MVLLSYEEINYCYDSLMMIIIKILILFVDGLLDGLPRRYFRLVDDLRDFFKKTLVCLHECICQYIRFIDREQWDRREKAAMRLKEELSMPATIDVKWKYILFFIRSWF